MNSIKNILIGLGLFALPFVSNAQLLVPTSDKTAPDSVIRLTAEAQGLERIAPESLPPFGTFWLVGSNGFAAPYPCLPPDAALVYRMTDGQYLIDGTDGQVSLNRHQTNATVEDALAAQAASVVALIAEVQTPKVQRLARTMSLDGGPLPPGPGEGGDGGTNVYYPTGLDYTPPDYGTNLWIAQVAITNGYLTGVASNTLADVSYEILTNGDLSTTNWGSTGLFVSGSETTNWTAFITLPVGRTNHLFFRLRSWASSDGSGLPDWWEQEYGVTDPYGDPDGDGWNNLQELQNGTSPLSFNPPPAPQNFTIYFDGTSRTATVSWSPAPGPVTGYTVTRTYYPDFYEPDQNQTFDVSANTLSVHDSTPFSPYANDNPTIYVYYSIQANYAGGNSASAGQWLQQTTVPVTPVPAADGSAMLTDFGLPPGSAGVLLTRTDLAAEGNYGDATYDTNYFIPLSAFTNGLFKIPTAWATPPVDGYGWNDYTWYVEPANASGGAAGSAQELLGSYYLAPNDVSLSPPFYDGRAQLKQDLIFQLRAATVSRTFAACPTNLSLLPGVVTSTNYVVSSYNLARVFTGVNENNWTWNGKNLHGDVLSPFKMNYYYRNFVFDPDALDEMGVVTNGIVFTGYDFRLLDSPAYQFPTPQAGMTNVPALLGTAASQWLAPGNIDDLTDFGIGFDDNYQNAYIIDGARNYYGLPFVSEKIAQVTSVLESLDYVTAGGTFPVMQDASHLFSYPETAQPQFQTAEYDFWDAAPVWDTAAQADQYTPLPGMPDFSPANVSRQFYMAVGGQIQIAGYAKLTVTNAYPGVYAYLGQYFDRAYQMADGVATTNQTGVLSPYGNFFATAPGPVALVTMPDIDTGERGTGIVQCVSLVLDKNHDLVMDKSFNGPDATSQASPMVWWINDDYDYSGASWNLGHDAPANWYYNDGYQALIGSQRDLEDYARLWICGMPALTNGYQVTLSWANVSSGSPTINLFNTVETNGGIGYLTDTNVAAAQYGGLDNNVPGNPGRAIATISPGQSFTFPASYFTNAGDKYFLFDGAITNGAGELMLTIADGNGNTIAQTGTWLDLHDVKDFYERAVITNNISSSAISNWTSGIEIVQPATASALGDDTNLIVLVHGINVADADWLVQSDTVFKRLYWAGYRGKFMTVKWPCNYLTPPQPLTIDVFNLSEAKAYKASTALTTYLNQLRSRFQGYRLNLLVHSQGNAVASEAIKNGAPFDTYVLTQGAISDGAYDVNATNFPDFIAQEVGTHITPEWQPMGYRGIYTNSNFTGKIVNFYNPQDGVLAIWQTDQIDDKPSVNYFYDGTDCWLENFFMVSHLVTDFQETRAMVSRARSLSVGQSGPASAHGVIQSAVDLNAQFGFSTAIAEHSAQWTRPIQTCLPYYSQVLLQIKPLQ